MDGGSALFVDLKDEEFGSRQTGDSLRATGEGGRIA